MYFLHILSGSESLYKEHINIGFHFLPLLVNDAGRASFRSDQQQPSLNEK
jgi:hypothetical protein